MVKMTLAALRRNCKLTQAKAAKEIGVSPKTLSNWETGTTFPTQQHIEKMCELYGVSYDNINFDA